MKWWTSVVLLCVTAVLADDEWLEVKLPQGPVRGRKHPNGGLYGFHNIPYATAPTGENKFKDPLPPPTWTEPFDATNEKIVVCPQNDGMSQIFPFPIEMKEDCLIANVLVPDTTEKNLSVLVYVHGGGYSMGFGNYFTGTQFVKEKKDVIMVSLNYRLGVYGFLCLGTEDAPGNAGLKDVVALLRWVQENIASFGGNPDDVTLAGFSAGSAIVDLLMLSKLTEGLFQRVILESAGSLAVTTVQRDPLENARTFAKYHNVTNVNDIKALGQFYKTAPLDLLIAQAFDDGTDSTIPFSPCVELNTDGAVLTASPRTILQTGDYKKVPMLYGFTNMDGLLRIPFFETWKDQMNAKFSDFLPGDLKFESDEERQEVAETVKKFYFGDNLVSNETILNFVDFFTDLMFTHPMLKAVQLHAEAGNNQIYLYEYSFVDENVPPVIYTDVRGADHCAQSYAWLDNFDGSDESLATPEYQKMRKIVRAIWHNFIKTGVPIPEGSSLPVWPAAGVDRSPHLALDENVELGEGLLEERFRLWDDIYLKNYLDAILPRKQQRRWRL